MNELKDFYELNKICNLTFYKKFTEPIKYQFDFENYLSDNSNITKSIIKTLQQNGKQTFLFAPTGSGKTYTMIHEVFQQTKNNNHDTVNFICVPNHSQAKQIEQEYHIPALVGGENKKEIQYYIDEDLQLHLINQTYSCVYDKVSEIITFIEYLQQHQYNIKVNLVIDEAHSLSAAKFRNHALQLLQKTIQLVLNHHGSVLYTTASAEAMAWISFDNYIFCTQKNPKTKFNSLKVYINNDKTISFHKFMIETLHQNGNGIVRLNDKTLQTKTKKELEELQHTVEKVNGDEKGYTVDENDQITYNNDLLDAVVNHSTLPNVDYSICTSMLDAGQNITGIGDEKLQPKDFHAYYIINNYHNLNLLNIQQFANRLRFPFDSYQIIYCNLNVNEKLNKKFYSLNSLIPIVFQSFQKSLQYLKETESALKKKYENETNQTELVQAEMNHILNYQNQKYQQDNSFGNAISYTNGEFLISYAYLLQYILETYYHELYGNFNEFKHALEELFHINVEVYTITKNIDCNKTVEIEKLTKKDLLKYYNDKDFLKNYKNSDYQEITETKLFQECIGLTKLGESISDAIYKTCTYSNQELNQLKSKLIKKKLTKYLTTEEKELLCEIIKGEKELCEISNVSTYETIDRILKNTSYVKYLKKGLLIGIDIDTMIHVIEESKNNRAISNYLKEYQAIQNNKNYLIDNNLLSSKNCRVQRIILDYVTKLGFQLDTKNRFKMSAKRIEELIQLIKYEESVTYTKRQLENYLKLIFKTSEYKYTAKANILELLTLKLN